MTKVPKGKAQFTTKEIEQIFDLVRQKNNADRTIQKRLRNRIRILGFYYSNFSAKKDNYTIDDIKKLVADGLITISDNKQIVEPKIKTTSQNIALQTNIIKTGFPCLHNEESTILILGTMPGDISLGKIEYYSNPRNSFWKILCKIYNKPFCFQTYDEKVDFLVQHKIALWDLYQKADRDGSLDADIKSGIVNDINLFLKEHPSITKVLFNGKEPERVYKLNFQKINNIHYSILPSTSSTHSIKLEQKVQLWKDAIMKTNGL